MKRILPALLVSCVGGLAWAQSSEPKPKFEATDVHVSVKTAQQFARIVPVRGGRYEIKNATMVDLIRIGHGFENDKILGGPSWLEMDRYDVIGKVPAGSTVDTHKLMLQVLDEPDRTIVR
jgi:uncharacterized protein (TIGR03435 family)